MSFRNMMFDISKRAMTYFAPSQDIAALYGPASNSASGTVVTERTAMNVGTVFACVRIISEVIASMPLVLYQKKSGTRTPADQHPVFNMLKYKTNDETHAIDYMAYEISCLLLWGNGYAQIIRRGDGKAMMLRQMNPDRTTVLRELESKEIIYRTADLYGYTVELPASDVVHIHGPGFDGITGKSVISLARETVGLALAAEAFGAKFYGQGAHPDGILEHPNRLGKEAYERLKLDWKNRQAGLDNAHTTAILEEGMKFNPITIPPDQAQFLATRLFQKSEIAGWYGVPLPLLQTTEKTTSWGTGITQLVDGFLKFTLWPIMRKIEWELLTKLFLPKDWENYEIRFVNHELVREALLTRFQVYTAGITNGVYSVNEARGMEGMDPVDGGDKHIQPLNMKDITTPDPEPADPAAEAGGDGNEDEPEGGDGGEVTDGDEDPTAKKKKKVKEGVTDGNDADAEKIKKDKQKNGGNQ